MEARMAVISWYYIFQHKKKLQQHRKMKNLYFYQIQIHDNTNFLKIVI